MAAPVSRQPRHRVCEAAPVEVSGALPRDLLEGVGQVALREQAPLSDAAVDRPRFGARRVDGLDDLENARLQRVDPYAFPCRPQGRLHQTGHGQARQLGVDGIHPGQGPRGRRRAQADVELLGGGAEISMHWVKVDVRGVFARSRCLDEEVVNDGRATGGVREQKAAAAKGCQHRLGDAGCEVSGDGSVEGVASFLEDLRRGGRGCPMATRNGP